MIEALLVLIVIVAIGVMGGVNYYVVAKLTPDKFKTERGSEQTYDVLQKVSRLEQFVEILQKQRAEMNEEMVTIKNQFKTIVGIYENSQSALNQYLDDSTKIKERESILIELGKNLKLITTKK